MMNQQQLLIRGLQISREKTEDSYVDQIPAIHSLTSLTFTHPITIFAGENGTGKSTFLEAIAIAAGFNGEGGTRNYTFTTYDSHSDLHERMKLIRNGSKIQWGYFLRAESFYNVATKEEEYSRLSKYPSEHLHEKSHGESFLYIASHHFRKGGLYLLDEPEAALSPQRQLTLMLEINRCVKEGSQFIIATHSPLLMAMPHTSIYSFDDGVIHPVTYEETGSYQIMEMFINHKERMFHELFDEEITEE